MPGLPHDAVKKQLQQHRAALLEMLRRGDYSQMQRLINRITGPHMRQPQPYDRYRITPYTSEVADKYGLEYVNASLVPLGGEMFIACQCPRQSHEHLFRQLVLVSRARQVICLTPESRYFESEELLEQKIVEKDGRIFLTESLYKIDERSVRVIKCHTWADHSILPAQEMQQLIAHANAAAGGTEEAGCPVIVYCMAGVGRTGTYLAYKTLSEMRCVTADIFVDLLIELRSCRPHMVQSTVQLRFLAEHFLGAQPMAGPDGQGTIQPPFPY